MLAAARRPGLVEPAQIGGHGGPDGARVVYGFGFTAPVLAMILAMPRRADPTGESDPEPIWLVLRIFDARGWLKLAGLLTPGGAIVSCLVLAMPT